MALEELAGKVRPVVLAGERVLPVLEPLAPLLPDGGLRRGSVVSVAGLRGPNAVAGLRGPNAVAGLRGPNAVAGLRGPNAVAGLRGPNAVAGLRGPNAMAGSTSLALALLAGASATGSWCAAVGLPSLGVVAAAELGVALDRFPLVASPPNSEEWAWATAALLDAVDVVLARPPGRIRDAIVRRLAARARERSAVLVVAGAAEEWHGADVRLSVTAAEWEGVGQGHGRLWARRVEVVATGRAAAARERRATLWLPGPDGGVAAAAGVRLAGANEDETAVMVAAGAG